MRVLVMDGERRLAGGIKRGLEAEGFAVDVAVDGLDGLERAAAGHYDAILLDLALPDMDARKVCSSLRQAGNWTPIIVVTTPAGEQSEAEALDSGADDFLSKPFSFVVLLARLRALLRRCGRVRPPVLAAGDLRLDPAAHRVWRGNVEILLSPRQFFLLQYLMGRAGEVVSKAEILEEVWEGTFRGDPNIVEVYVRHLRKRVDEPFGRNAIQTVRLVGYRLATDGG